MHCSSRTPLLCAPATWRGLQQNGTTRGATTAAMSALLFPVSGNAVAVAAGTKIQTDVLPICATVTHRNSVAKHSASAHSNAGNEWGGRLTILRAAVSPHGA